MAYYIGALAKTTWNQCADYFRRSRMQTELHMCGQFCLYFHTVQRIDIMLAAGRGMPRAFGHVKTMSK